MAKDFNGSTFKWPDTTTTSSIALLRNVGFSSQGAKVRVSGADSTRHLYEAGIPDNEVTLEIVGHYSTALEVGDTGVITIGWNSGETDSMTGMVIVSASVNGGMDAEITSSITFAPNS